MAVEPDNLAIGDDYALVCYQVFKADASPQFANGKQRVALLVIDEDIIELHLVEWRDGNRTDTDLGIQEFTQSFFTLFT